MYLFGHHLPTLSGYERRLLSLWASPLYPLTLSKLSQTACALNISLSRYLSSASQDVSLPPLDMSLISPSRYLYISILSKSASSLS
jgi:hypothetical protein